MANKPNAMGRIEAEPKVKRHLPWKTIGAIVAGIVLVIAGISGTLGYQSFINNVKAEGVADYKLNSCDKYMNEDKSATWLECDQFRIENNQ